ncbi:MAG: TerB family tellurite resistance protein [Candidatus Hydrogenedentes bacterium]|nr:TerB family tellurite resistance protein [Candidatus Hydrogenedentota bacterium]
MLGSWFKKADPGEQKETREKRLQRAVCMLLLEAAAADNTLDPAETDRAAETLRGKFGLDDDEVRDLFDACAAAREGSVGLFEHTNTVNQRFTQEERVWMMEELWRVFLADGVLSAHEDHLAHRFMDLLRLNHRQFIDAKLRARGV